MCASRTGIVVDIVDCGSSEQESLEFRRTDSFFHLIVMADHVSEVSSTRSYKMHNPRSEEGDQIALYGHGGHNSPSFFRMSIVWCGAVHLHGILPI